MFNMLFDKFKTKKDKASVLKRLMKDPDDHIFTMEVIEDEIVIRIKRKDKEQV